jgi:hypothetical protein
MFLSIAFFSAANSAAPQKNWPEIVRIGGSGANEWASVGNHRFNVTLPTEQSSLVLVRAQWRRSDLMPLTKAVYIRTSNNTPVPCRFASEPDADSATFAFVPNAGIDSYYIYYMPFATCEYQGGSCRSHATVNYIHAYTKESCAKFTNSGEQEATKADPILIEAVYDPRAPFESFEPMGMPMTAKEHAAFLSTEAALLVVPERRELPVRMLSQLPARWAKEDTKHPRFAGIAQPGENFTFQLAAYAPEVPVAVRQVTFSNLVANSTSTNTSIEQQMVAASALRVLNLGGIDFWGRKFTHTNVTVGAGDVLSLWVAVVVPANTNAGVYHGTATVKAVAAGSEVLVEVAIELTVQGAVLPHGGDDDVTRGTRLHWFDSSEGTEMETVPAPFTPVNVTHEGDGMLITMLGKRIRIGHTGLPTTIEVETRAHSRGRASASASWVQVLDEPVGLALQGMAAAATSAITYQPATNMSVQWQSITRTARISLIVDGEVDCTGYMSFNATVANLDTQAAAETAVNLTLPSANNNAHFAMGLGRKGGFLQSFLNDHSSSSHLSSWVVFDFGRNMTLDGMRAHSYGDGVHDPWHMYLQGAKSLAGGGFAWAGSNITSWLIGKASNGSESKPVPMTQDFSFAAPMTAQRWRWVILDCHPSTLTKHSHAMIAEIEFHEVGSAKGVYVLNNGTEEDSLVVSSSGDGTNTVDNLIQESFPLTSFSEQARLKTPRGSPSTGRSATRALRMVTTRFSNKTSPTRHTRSRRTPLVRRRGTGTECLQVAMGTTLYGSAQLLRACVCFSKAMTRCGKLVCRLTLGHPQSCP